MNPRPRRLPVTPDVAACRQGVVVRLAGGLPDGPRGPAWGLDWRVPPHGRIISVRRTNDPGALTELDYPLEIARTSSHRLVRCESTLNA